MKLKPGFLLIVSVFFTTVAFAQSYSSGYDWEKEPKFMVTDSVQHIGYIYKISDKTTKEIWINSEGRGELYETIHLRFKILTEAAIDLYNKIEISLYGVEEILKLKARTIKADGTVSNLPTSAIKHISNYNESGVDYKSFVFEGLEIGSEVEYLYTFKRTVNVYGWSYLQWNADAGSEEFKLIYPSHLDFRIKSYGTGITVTSDTIKKDSREYIYKTFTNSKVKGIKSEPYANWKAHLARVDYVLDKNTQTGNYEMSTYKILAQNYYTNIYPDDPKPNKKGVSLLKKINGNNTDKTQTAKNIENYVKLNFKTADSPSDKNMNRIFTGLQGSFLDKCSAFIDLFRAAGFKVELVFTADNSSRLFDPEFETPSNCNEFLIYLPEINYFMSPENILMRSGYYDQAVFEQKGMFVKQVCVGDFCSGVHYISTIPAKKAEESVHDMNLDISFSPDMSNTRIKFENTMTGYHSSSYQPIFGFLEQSAQDELKKGIVEGFTGEYIKADIEVENGSYEASFEKPFILKGEATTETLLENAGDRYLFKIGFVLGEQYEMYDKVQRQLPIENDYNRIYSRTIKVTVPDGYEISNMQDFQNNKISCDYNGKDAAGINFEYSLSGNIFTIKIVEYYNILNLPIEEYDEYVKVINGSADFNKKGIFFSPKK
jgi:hypothetical protein